MADSLFRGEAQQEEAGRSRSCRTPHHHRGQNKVTLPPPHPAHLAPHLQKLILAGIRKLLMQRILQDFGNETHPISAEEIGGGRWEVKEMKPRKLCHRSYFWNSRDFLHRADDSQQEFVCYGSHVLDGGVQPCLHFFVGQGLLRRHIIWQFTVKKGEKGHRPAYLEGWSCLSSGRCCPSLPPEMAKGGRVGGSARAL